MESMRNSHLKSGKRWMLALVASIFFVSCVFGQTPATPPAEAMRLIERGQNDEAVNLLKKAIDKNPSDAELWLFLGYAYLNINKVKDSIKALDRSIALDSKVAMAHFFLADALVRSSKSAEAATEAKLAIQLDPSYPYVYYTLALINLRQSAFEDAVINADHAISLKSDFAEAYLIKAQALINSSFDLTDRDQSKALSRSAVEPLRKYVEFTTNTRDAEIWTMAADMLEGRSSSSESQSDSSTDSAAPIVPGKDLMRPGSSKARLIAKPEPNYTEEARQYQIEGTVVLKVIFSSTGKVTRIYVTKTLPKGLTEQAIRAAKQIQFHPALRDGKPVSMWIQLEYNFNLY